MDDQTHQVSLIELPDPCLVAVLRSCADDPRSVCSAARAHSRLHQAAVAALGSISASLDQDQVRSLQLYLPKYCRFVSIIILRGASTDDDGKPTVTACQLPADLTKLSRLQFENIKLQLQRDGEIEGVVPAGVPIKQLHLNHCVLLGVDEGLAAALLLLPELEHLSIKSTYSDAQWREYPVVVTGDMLHPLQQLTGLELTEFDVREDGGPLPGIPQLTALTCLQDMRLEFGENGGCIEASDLAGTLQLTRLDVSSTGRSVLIDTCDDVVFEVGGLAGKTKLQHLRLVDCFLDGDEDSSGQSRGSDSDGSFTSGDRLDAAGIQALLSQLGELQQLTHLDLKPSNAFPQAPWRGPPARAYSALTASSKLQHLSIIGWIFPSNVWAHIFPPGRQLPHLRVLDMSCAHFEGHVPGPADGNRLVSCCPELQSLQVQTWQCSANLLEPLHGLSSLQQLGVSVRDASDFQLVCHLTGIRQLTVHDRLYDNSPEYLPLTQLQQLTCLKHQAMTPNHSWLPVDWALTCQAACDEPVWIQLLRRYVNHEDSEVAEHSAAALAEWTPLLMSQT